MREGRLGPRAPLGRSQGVERVRKIAEGAAMMTETSVEIRTISGVSNLLGNTPLELAMQRQLDRLGPPPFDATDRAYAAQIQATLSPEDIASAFARAGVPPKKDTPLCDFVVPYGTRGAAMMGSTDVGDVSWVVPTVQARVATHAIGTPGHSWQITAQGKWVFGGGLTHPSSATVVRSEDGETVLTDGPYLETKEQLGGFWVVEAADLDEALDLAARASAAML